MKIHKIRNIDRMILQGISIVVNIDTWQLIEPCDVLLACGDADRGYIYRDKRYAQLIDSLGDLLKLNGIFTRTVAHRLSQYIGKNGYDEPASINRALIRSILGAPLVSLCKGRIAGRCWQETSLKQLWEKIISRCRPKAVIAIQPDVGLCRAGHELGIQVFDLQHGLISDAEDNVYYWSDNLVREESTDLPHGFLCWDKSSAETMMPIAMEKKMSVRIIGNPWFSRFIDPHPQDELVKTEMACSADSQHGLPKILVTLQYNLGEYAHDYVENGVMADCLEKVILATSDQYIWNLRLHPSQLRGSEGVHVHNYLQKRFGNIENIDWVRCSAAALPCLLSLTDLHITHFSATTIEASWMGVHTGLLDPHICSGGKHSDFFVSERALGFAEKLPLDVMAIKKFINSSLAKGKSGSIPMRDIACVHSFIDEIKQLKNYNIDAIQPAFPEKCNDETIKYE
jgi:hypothetical protein